MSETIKLTGDDYGSFELSKPQITRLLNSCGLQDEIGKVETVHVGGYIGGVVGYDFDGEDTGMSSGWDEIPSEWRTEIRRDAIRSKAKQ